ncbi:MAG: response regulator [Verrucomicrobiales bacterium]|nr:response regulator [Verrucomicrobiales bacterium]
MGTTKKIGAMTDKWTKVLFVDDDTALLELLRQVMGHYSNDTWEIYTATDAVDALAILQEQSIRLLVIDLHMPVVSGLQFLKMLQRKYPDLLKVILTADATDAERGACLDAGADLYLQKPQVEGGWRSIYAALAELLKFQPRGATSRRVLRSVTAQDTLQMECLAGNSTVLEVAAPDASGKIFIEKGALVHAVAGELEGEEAAIKLLSAPGAEARVRPFTRPERHSINAPWQAVLATAARRKAEYTRQKPPQLPSEAAVQTAAQLVAEPNAHANEAATASKGAAALEPAAPHPQDQLEPRIEEILICSLAGEVLYQWQCPDHDARINLLEFVSQKARQISTGLGLGALERFETRTENSRTITRLDRDRATFVRASYLHVKH